MDWKTLIAIGIQHGLPVAQQIFTAMWDRVTDETGSNVSWESVQAKIAEGRGDAQAGIADADAEIDRQRARTEAEEAAAPEPATPAALPDPQAAPAPLRRTTKAAETAGAKKR